MGGYDGWSIEQLTGAIFSADPDEIDDSAGSWHSAQKRTEELGRLLAKKLEALMHDWKGLAAGEFDAYMKAIHTFCGSLSEDQGEMGDGMWKCATAAKQARDDATQALKLPQKTKEQKEIVRKKLVKILTGLATGYKGAASSSFKAPTKAPANLPTVEDPELEPQDVVTTLEPEPGKLDPGAPPYDPTPYDPVPSEPVPYVPQPGYDNGDTETGLASATPLGLGAATGGPGGGFGPGFSPGGPGTATGLAAAGGPAFGTFGGAPAPARGPAMGSGAAGRGHQHEDEEEQGNRTWLTEDEMVWGGAEGTPAAVVDQRG
ncbi:hypothetical protein Afil01_65980 [Actinorhabdospora filicis]|uniref:WXG100 family type VII secretion target n=1 Tax=Actinorhabdospora filicis TaxID=1785913 RepID=A0A9W6SW22_9ACTN|nr:hypothetical protein [Actinorhabdospora filicis]GLZ81791.1 hypothetical protein Afil01_65980 [Actinorhabdospora filicis]